MIVYKLVIFLYTYLASITAIFNQKARKWTAGRIGLFHKIKDENIAEHHPIWFHCASLGEFEQARYIIDKLHLQGHKILLTFFSPSGYEIRKNYKHADWVFYLPTDTKKHAKKFIQYTQPSIAVFVKYDLWYYFLEELTNSKIPKILISAIYSQDQIYFRRFTGKIHRKMLSFFEHIYVQNNSSKDLLEGISVNAISVVGDSRIDSVIDRKISSKKIANIEDFLGGKKAIIIGSAYLHEVNIIASLKEILSTEKIIIAPHEIDKSNINSIQKILGIEAILYSELDGSEHKSNILIIDNIGLLFDIYQYGKLAFIGGGFTGGLHNTLEPAAFGIPICFGPKFSKFQEAKHLVERKGAFLIQNKAAFKSLYLRLKDPSVVLEIKTNIHAYLEESKGASLAILEGIKKYKGEV